MRKDGALVGLGMASGVWESPQLPASASAVLTARRHAHRVERDGRYRHGHLHDHDADRGRDARPAAESGDVQVGRFIAAEGTGRRRIVHCGDRGLRPCRRRARRCATSCSGWRNGCRTRLWLASTPDDVDVRQRAHQIAEGSVSRGLVCRRDATQHGERGRGQLPRRDRTQSRNATGPSPIRPCSPRSTSTRRSARSACRVW